MKAIIFDTIAGILGGVHLNMSLRSVEHMGHSDTLEIIHVTDGVAIAKNDAIIHLVTVNSQVSSLIIVTGGFEAWQWPVFSCSRVNYRVY